MNPELSRRVGKLMGTNAIMALSIADKNAFIHAVSTAKNFESLDPQWQRVVVQAERDAANGNFGLTPEQWEAKLNEYSGVAL